MKKKIYGVLKLPLYPLIFLKRLLWNKITRKAIKWGTKLIIKSLRYLLMQLEALLVFIDY